MSAETDRWNTAPPDRYVTAVIDRGGGAAQPVTHIRVIDSLLVTTNLIPLMCCDEWFLNAFLQNIVLVEESV